jgi:hypothetical protein
LKLDHSELVVGPDPFWEAFLEDAEAHRLVNPSCARIAPSLALPLLPASTRT